MLVEADKNIGIGRANRRRVALGEIDPAIGQADVVNDARDLLRRNVRADGTVDQVAQACGLFDSRTGARAQVQLELAAIHGWEEISAQPRDQYRERHNAESEKCQQEETIRLQATVQ